MKRFKSFNKRIKKKKVATKEKNTKILENSLYDFEIHPNEARAIIKGEFGTIIFFISTNKWQHKTKVWTGTAYDFLNWFEKNHS